MRYPRLVFDEDLSMAFELVFIHSGTSGDERRHGEQHARKIRIMAGQGKEHSRMYTCIELDVCTNIGARPGRLVAGLL